MADWMLCLDYGDDLTSATKERRNPSAAASASARRKTSLVLWTHGNLGGSFNSVFQKSS